MKFSYCVVISKFYGWKCRSKTVNTVTQQHPQGPGSVLSLSSAIIRLSLAFVLELVVSGPSTAHTAISRAEGMLFLTRGLFIREKNHLQKSFSPTDFPSCLIGQICVTRLLRN